jgi:hypothetical protein
MIAFVRGLPRLLVAQRRVAEQVGGQPDRRRPGDAAERVPEREGPPGHAVDAGQPRRGDPQHGDPPAEEDRLGPVAGEEGLAAFEDAHACERGVAEPAGDVDQSGEESSQDGHGILDDGC